MTLTWNGRTQPTCHLLLLADRKVIDNGVARVHRPPRQVERNYRLSIEPCASWALLGPKVSPMEEMAVLPH